MKKQKKLSDLFGNPALYEAVRKQLFGQRFISMANDDSTDLSESEFGNECGIDCSIAADDYDTIVIKQMLRPIFDKHVLSRIGRPHFISHEDFEEAVFTYLAGRRPSAFDHCIKRLEEALRYKCDPHFLEFTPPVEARFAFGAWVTKDRTGFDYYYPSEEERRGTIWVSSCDGKGFELEFRESYDERHNDTVHYTLVLQGDCTRHAYDAATGHFERLIAWAHKTILVLLRKLCPEEFGSYELPPSIVQDPRATLFHTFAIPFLQECITSYFLRPDKSTQNTDQRLHNAVRLLIEADQQQLPAIGLALCFSAIEALLCNNIQGIMDELSRNVATLLQPDSREREGIIKAVKKLYGLRCKAMHGQRIADDLCAWGKMRTLAIAVLAGVMDWRKYQLRLGDTPERRRFFEELHSATIAGAQFIGPNTRLAECLPLESEQTS